MLSRNDLWLLFVAAAFPVHVWAFLQFFLALPGYLYRLSLVEILTTLAYVSAFSFLESLALSIAYLLVSLVLPRRLLRTHFAVRASFFFLISALWLIPLHYLAFLGLDELGEIQVAFFSWVFSYFLALLTLNFFISHKKPFTEGVHRFLDRLSVLVALYVFFDGLVSIFLMFTWLVGSL